MVQVAVLDGQFFDPVPPFDDGGVAAEMSNVSAYGTDWRYFVREDFRLIVVTEGSEDETEITDKTNGCCEGDQGHPPGNTHRCIVFFRSKKYLILSLPVCLPVCLPSGPT